MDRKDFEKIFDGNLNRYLTEWKELLRFPSISADPAKNDDCVRCAEWLVGHLSKLGFKAEALKTESKPVVFAVREGAPGATTILYYGHYDVQPPDPLNEWTSPPFEPEVRGDRLYARGALDNKGQTMYFLKGLEAVLQAGGVRPTIKIVIEGEEECGSEALFENLENWREKLKADLLMVCDTEAYAPGVPAVTMGLRGIAHATVRLKGGNFDLHSGIHGGIAPNPATAIARLVATLHNPDGSIAVDGFYSGVSVRSDEERKRILAMPFNPKKYEEDTGVKPLGGEASLSPQERVGLRPTIEINGIHSGYGGPGHKTIIPSVAEAKITTRLVVGQNPVDIVKKLETHLRKHAPKGLVLEVTDTVGGGEAVALPASSPIVASAEKVLKEACGNAPVLVWSGASIPIVARLASVSGAAPLLVGFGLPDDRLHAPNESFAISQFKQGFLYSCLMLQEIGSR